MPFTSSSPPPDATAKRRASPKVVRTPGPPSKNAAQPVARSVLKKSERPYIFSVALRPSVGANARAAQRSFSKESRRTYFGRRPRPPNPGRESERVFFQPGTAGFFLRLGQEKTCPPRRVPQPTGSEFFGLVCFFIPTPRESLPEPEPRRPYVVRPETSSSRWVSDERLNHVPLWPNTCPRHPLSGYFNATSPRGKTGPPRNEGPPKWASFPVSSVTRNRTRRESFDQPRRVPRSPAPRGFFRDQPRPALFGSNGEKRPCPPGRRKTVRGVTKGCFFEKELFDIQPARPRPTAPTLGRVKNLQLAAPRLVTPHDGPVRRESREGHQRFKLARKPTEIPTIVRQLFPECRPGSPPRPRIRPPIAPAPEALNKGAGPVLITKPKFYLPQGRQEEVTGAGPVPKTSILRICPRQAKTR